MRSEIMYIELTGPGHRTAWARIGRVAFSKTGRTAYYDGRTLVGMGRAWYRDEATDERLWIQHARAGGRDRRGDGQPGSVRITIDDDAREEYWTAIRAEPRRAHERSFYG